MAFSDSSKQAAHLRAPRLRFRSRTHFRNTGRVASLNARLLNVSMKALDFKRKPGSKSLWRNTGGGASQSASWSPALVLAEAVVDAGNKGGKAPPAFQVGIHRAAQALRAAVVLTARLEEPHQGFHSRRRSFHRYSFQTYFRRKSVQELHRLSPAQVARIAARGARTRSTLRLRSHA